MSSTSKMLGLIYTCALELNKQLPEERRLKCDEGTVLVGDSGALDSLGLITLTVNVEQQIGALGMQCSVMDELMNDHDADAHPFASMGSMAHWLTVQTTDPKASN